MTGVELSLAIIATVDLCFKYGKALSETCAHFRNADKEIAERLLRIQAIWLRTKSQLDFVRQLAPTLDEEHWTIQEETLKVLANKLDIANTKICSYLKKSGGDLSLDNELQVKRSKYALFGKNLDKTFDELEGWQRTFDPSWYLIMKAAKPQIDIELENLRSRSACAPIPTAQSLRAALKNDAQVTKPIFLPRSGLDTIQISALPHCSAELGERSDSNKDIILDRVTCPAHVNARLFKTNVRNLARKLSHADPVTFGLLTCKGVVEHKQTQDRHTAFTIVFKVPREFSAPRSLRSRLLDGDAAHSLSDRFKIANQLAKSVGYVHTFGFVHKNILPETVLLFKVPESSVGSVSLVGFGCFRDAEGDTLRSGDSMWEKNIYRHPRRQGQEPQEDYIMQHDIYSLGVCLLEVGLWQSFVVYDGNSTVPSPSPALGFAKNGTKSQDPTLTKDRLLSMTRDLLPRHMGTIYAETVETCLTCLDETNTEFGNEQEFCDDDGILVGARYIEKVIVRLNSICI